MAIKDLSDQELIIQEWGRDFYDYICGCKPLNMQFDEFLNHCTACGGNWSAMLLSGLKIVHPRVYEAIPERMGMKSFFCIAATLRVLGVQT